MIRRSASKLRNDIFALQMKQIFESATVDNTMEGEAIPLVSVKILFKMIYTGNVSTTEETSSNKSRLIDSSASDAVFCCSTGNSWEQLSLGLGLKSMAESKIVLTLISHYRHCASSEIVWRVDMSLMLILNNSDSFIPDIINSISLG